MDIYERVAYSAFDVPDVLTDENQLKAAGAALLRASGISIAEPRMLAYQQCAEIYVDEARKMLASGTLDPLIGDFRSAFYDISTAIRHLGNAAYSRILESQPGAPPQEEAEKLASTVLEQVISWVKANPDAKRELSRGL